MEFTIRSKYFDFCIRTKRMYSPMTDEFHESVVAIRIGGKVWSTTKGFRKLVV